MTENQATKLKTKIFVTNTTIVAPDKRVHNLERMMIRLFGKHNNRDEANNTRREPNIPRENIRSPYNQFDPYENKRGG